MKTDYYELLGVETKCGETELKKAYRRKALQLHPDKNPDNVEEATRQFNLVRAAYEVLSDPQERAWYDSHKNSILREDNDYADEEGSSTSYEVVGTSTDELLRYFDPSMYSRIDDSIQGFYKVAAMLFAKLASEEVFSGKQQELDDFYKYKDDSPSANVVDSSELLFPRFGDSRSDYATEVRVFYQKWSSFQSIKTFSWVDEYRYSRTHDRRTRRLVDKENKKARDNARREYNETVRSYVAFIKKRDPRVKSGAAAFEKAKRKKEQEEKRKQAQRDREANLAKRNEYQQQNWQTIDAGDFAEIEEQLDKLHEEDLYANKDEKEQDEENIYECIICNKDFKSKRQFKEHEKSKKHLKLLRRLKWEMRKEGIELGFDTSLDESDMEDEFETASSGDEFQASENETETESENENEVENNEKKAEKDNYETENSTKKLNLEDDLDSEIEIDDAIDSDYSGMGSFVKKEKEKKQQRAPSDDSDQDQDATQKNANQKGVSINELHQLDDDSDNSWDMSKNKNKKSKKDKKKKVISSSSPFSSGKNNNVPVPKTSQEAVSAAKLQDKKNLSCAACNEVFPSRNKLFQHVNSTGHAAPVPINKKGKNKKR
ncbi:hypothetical protein PACTADRAFT_45467 [Pachysolen tannophilus NRRL Y-2460]|uniref:J domain-containing protein n=1 Tax=Pachysolen tannophilus NRRL Y-2460 TaxID=669874 RepID=A0A1E4TPM0_PACTA|nr:hypothetical protein PACTADRAFT_45467 [Pachysolen tannophilus NRRL Y-2460]